ncbi:MAG TPA: restriction endonuclease subunit S [Candidatus Accumulibacter phosphatis]|uniref:restriction endonuclease subunit S n=1 Tax=Accumulibacter sp. TaxID=2053492 RepID=UPI001A3EB59F|nr:restriction endonuclease subunit S [Accumulibacter sp.]MBL8408793.1 restriction endonuclease subunit S [Accumulibacter sp.]HRF11396.1 restriction endonuclease subunit S [Candidatus Accumulibacter phosphatis]
MNDAHDRFLDTLPAGWKFDRFKDIVTLRNEKTDESSAEEDYLELEDLESGSGRILSRRNTLEVGSAVTLFKKGDVLFGKLRPYLEKYWEAEFDGKCTGEILAFKPQRIASRFLFYCLGSRWFIERCNALAYGAKMPRVSWPTQLSQFNFPLPPLPEQQRIAAYLDASCAAIDAAVAAKRRQLETLDEIRKSAVHQVLSEGLRLGLPLKDSGIESIGVIPAHWDVKQIRYACEVNYGITLQLEKGQSVGDGVRILTVSNLTIDGNLDLEDEYYIDPAELTRADYLWRGDLLFNWRNGSQYHVGKTAFFDMEGEVAHVSFLLRIRCGRHMDPFFLRSYLGILKDAGFFSGAKDKVNKTFNSSELKRLRVVIPPRDEQKEICAEIERRTKECNAVKAAIEKQITTLTAYRKSLIHECVTGQRRITEADLNRVKAHG